MTTQNRTTAPAIDPVKLRAAVVVALAEQQLKAAQDRARRDTWRRTRMAHRHGLHRMGS